ncbi:MAG: hypothetical protein COX79_04485 [Candidatus Levybacteria bacterium CG_4_10_14_0_2_um_filter_36_16]|nr:MAG: hypothetical protein AUK12_02075 [Candidatus Levybacteria bacterium CG2_30_37_29]PIZ96824.1 MAG: hypothetical protein COX79_04485 [Candidatus Levybacteria bacterium CG_4_10_14_0_2_um_filter_36_16]
MAGKKSIKKKINKYVRSHASLHTSHSYVSLLYGAFTVLVLFILIFLGISLISKRQMGEISGKAVQTSVEEENKKALLGKKEYIVAEGDSLWSIAEKTYQNGFAWTEIAKANNIKTPDMIEKGTKLLLPSNNAIKKTIPSPPNNNQKETIKGTSYTVVSGDNLWDISVRAYADGYKWPEIARVNNLTNPDLIHSGNTLKLPR